MMFDKIVVLWERLLSAPESPAKGIFFSLFIAAWLWCMIYGFYLMGSALFNLRG